MSLLANTQRAARGLTSNTRGALRIPVLREGFLDRGDFEEIGAKAVQAGGTFNYRTVDKGLFSRTYYNIEFTGSKRLLLWVAGAIDNGVFDA